MNAYGNCDMCSNNGPLYDGLCAPCAGRFHSPMECLTTERMLMVLSKHVGETNGITITELVTEMVHPGRVPVEERSHAERSARELVMQLRLAGHHVCANPTRGYFMAANPEELDAQCKFLYDRAMTGLTQVAAMRRVSLPDLRGQLQLPT